MAQVKGITVAGGASEKVKETPAASTSTQSNKGNYGAANAGVNRSAMGSVTAGKKNMGGSSGARAAARSGSGTSYWVKQQNGSGDPYAWGNTKSAGRKYGDVDPEKQKKIDNLGYAYNDPDRSFHFYEPDEGSSQSYLDEANTINRQRSLYQYSSYWTLKEAGLDTLDDAYQWMQDAQIYAEWAEKNNFTVVDDNGQEHKVADLWKEVFDDASFDANYGYYINGRAEDRDSKTTQAKLEQAQAMLGQAKTDEDRERWETAVGALSSLRSMDNRNDKERLLAQIADNDQQILQLTNQRRSADNIVQYWDPSIPYDNTYYDAKKTADGIGEQAAALSKANSTLQARIGQLDADFQAWNMTDEVQAAMDRLSIAKLGKAYSDEYIEQAVREGRITPGTGGYKEAAEQLRSQDQQLVDEWKDGLGLNREFYNWQSRMAGFSQSKAKQWSSAAANTFSLLGRATSEVLPTTKAKDPGKINELQRQYDDLMREYNATLDPKTLEEANGIEAQINELKNDRETIEWLDSFAKAVAGGSKSLNEWALKNYDESTQLMAQVKEGMSEGGKFATDLASTLADIGLDSVSHLGLASMAIRVFGSSAMDYQKMGADTLHQVLGAAFSTGVEMLTEKIGGTFGFAYGKGFTDDWIEAAIESVAKTKAGMNGLRLLAGVVSEGGEEVVSDLLAPFGEWLGNEAGRENWQYSVDVKEAFRDFLLGAVAGLFGEIAQIGGYKQKNNAILAEDAKVLANAQRENITSEKDLARLTRAEERLMPRGIKGALTVDSQGRIIAHSGEGENRHQKAVNVQVEGAQQLGYGRDVDVDEAYDTATSGAEERLPSAEGAAGKGPEITEADETAPEGLSAEEQRKQQLAEKERERMEGERDAETESASKEAALEENMPPESTEEQIDPESIPPVEEQREREDEEARLNSLLQDGTSTASETAPEAQAESIQQTTPEKAVEPVKPQGNEHSNTPARVSTAEEGKANISNGATANKTVAEVVPMVDKYISEGKVVSTVLDNPFKANGEQNEPPLSKKVAQWFKNKFPTGIRSKAIGGGAIVINERGIKNDIAHGVGSAKAATFAAIPDVIRNGIVVSRSDGSVKSVSITIAGKVNLAGTPVNVYCVLKQADDGSKRFYLHEVTDGNGNLYYQLGKNNNATSALQDSTGTSPASADVASTPSIAQNAPISNGTNTSTTTQQNDTIGSEGSDVNGETFDNGYEQRSNRGTWENGGSTSTGREGLANKPLYETPPFREGIGSAANTERSGINGVSERVYQVAGDQGQEEQIQPGGEQAVRRDARELHRPLFQGNEREVRERNESWDKEVDEYLNKGARFLPENQQPESLKKAIAWAKKAGVENVTVFYADSVDSVHSSGTSLGDPSVGIFVCVYKGTNAAKTIVHETVHNMIQRAISRGSVKSWFSPENIVRFAFKRARFNPDVLDTAYDRTKGIYAGIYFPEYFGKDTTFFNGEAFDENAELIEGVPDYVYERLHEYVSEELLCELVSNANDWFDTEEGVNDLTAVSAGVRNLLAFDGVFDEPAFVRKAAEPDSFESDEEHFNNLLNARQETPNIFNGLEDILNAFEEEDATWDYSALRAKDQSAKATDPTQALQEENEALKQQIAELQAQQGAQETQEAPSEPHTPGTVRESQSAFESTQATKGERTNTEENTEGPEGTFVSRTNADRTATANSLTDTQEKRDAQTKRLLASDNWTDDDVVIAQKLMFDMLKGIRDYQLHLKRKMTPEAFKVMTKQYNSLLERHKKMLSEAGQKLQANYEFTNGEKILTRAAHTYLGFTEDGRFAGGSPNAKNARIYSAIEDASERIAKAVETGDRQSLAQICKDISDIRNVKKMFGPLGKFASDMESRNLNRLVTSENGGKMLEDLAYGNLNAMCDDVQPYKHLNAVKTIRVMNMLSNMSTIVNNVANNWVQGATGNNALAQTMTKIASKPFANLTGQEVYATAGRGKAVRQQVRNAKMEALEMATLAQMYGITYENGRLELNDRGMFNPNINMFEQTMSLYKFLIGMGVEATDQVQAAGISKRMEAGLDREIAAGNISPQMKEQMMNEINHETSRLLYKDNNTFTNFVQSIRNFLNKIAHVGNEDIGTIGLGDITMAFAKIPANVVKTRLLMSPEGALYNVASYAKGVNKAKQMHSEVMAKNIAMDESLSDAAKWSRARQECSGRTYKKLTQIRDNYAQGLTFEHAVERAGYMQATEMSQFEMAQLSRKIGRAATSVGMVALGSILRGLGALRDFDQEPDDELKRMYREKGYSGLMINFNAIGRKGHEWKDGDVVIGGDFLEVIAMPLAIGAAAAESAGNAEGLNVDKYFKTVFGEGLEKAFTAVGDIPGMTDALNLYDSVSNSFANNDDIGGTLGSSALLYAANTLPSLFIPNAFSQAAAGLDNTMRDIYSADNVWEQAWNTVKNKGGVLIRQTIPASVDVWGNERTYGENRFMGMVNKSLLPGDARIFHQSKYEKEVERLVKAGYKGAIPKTSVSGSFEVGNETYKLTADEKRGFKLGRNQAQAVAFETFMDSKWYQQLNDDQRMKVFQALKTSAERDARQMVLDDRQLNVEVTRDKWESELGNINDQIQFLAAKQLAGYVWDRDERGVSDFAEMDNYLVTTYDKLSPEQRTLLNNSYSHLDDMNEARSKYGISSQMWQQAYDIYSDYNSDEGKARVEGGYKDWEQSEMWTKIANTTGATEKQMEFFTNNMKLYNHIAPQAEKYQTLVGSGWSRDSAQNLTKAMSDLKAINGNKTVSYKQRLTQIAKATDISEDQKWEAFFEYCPSSYTSIINKMVARRNRGVPYDKALREIGKWME